jgi:hypothetical protein
MRRALSSGLAPTSRSFVTQGPKSNASLFNLGGRTFSTTPNPPETKTTDHESFMTRFISGMETGNFDEDILNTTFETLVEASTKLVGATANSTAALVFMVPLLRLMIGARTNQPYSV